MIFLFCLSGHQCMIFVLDNLNETVKDVSELEEYVEVNQSP